VHGGRRSSYLALGLFLALAPASGKPLILGSLSEDLKPLQGYFRNQVLPKWRDDPRVIVDVTQYSESPARWAVYVPKKDLFVYMFVPSRMRTSVEPGRVQVVLPPVTGGRPVVVEERLESPAVVVSVDQFCPLASASLDVVVGDYVCSFLRIDVPVLGGPCSVEYVLKRDVRPPA
jgi:hypothetical protein